MGMKDRSLKIVVLAMLLGLTAGGFMMYGCGNDDDDNPPPAPVSSLTVQTETGALQGATIDNIVGAGGVILSAEKFLNIPYAAAPIGDLRWAAPAPPVPWDNVRDASATGNICPQSSGGNEDCLNVNVYRPALTPPNANLPVVLWVPGGGNTGGGNASYVNTAPRFAAENKVIAVMMNHRLGILGFLNHPAISPNGDGGNYGVQDVKAALGWIHRNIAAFGGNPNNVTLAGESSGSTNTCKMLVDPAAKDLFHAATLMSEDCVHDQDSDEVSERRSIRLSDAIGCVGDAATVAACLRAKTPAELVAAQNATDNTGAKPNALWNPHAPVPPADKIATGQWNQVPLLIGSTRWEGRYTFGSEPFISWVEQDYIDYVTRLVGAAETPSVLALYPANKYAPDQFALAYVAADIVTDASLRGLGGAYNIKLAKVLSAQVPTFYYDFADPGATAPRANGFERLAAHGSDVAFFWSASIPTPDNTFAGGSGSRQLSNEMIKYFGAFVRNHDPAVSGQVAWPPMTPTNRSVMTLLPAGESEVVDVSVLDALHNYDYWMSRPIILERGEIPPQGGCPEYCP